MNLGISAPVRQIDEDAAAVAAAFPAWHAWVGVNGMLYASKRTSPPVVLRSATQGGLEEEIRHAEAERAAGRWYTAPGTIAS